MEKYPRSLVFDCINFSTVCTTFPISSLFIKNNMVAANNYF